VWRPFEINKKIESKPLRFLAKNIPSDGKLNYPSL